MGKVIKLLSLGMIAVCLISGSEAMAGELVRVKGLGRGGEATKADAPQIVLAQGLLPEKLTKYYQVQVQNLLAPLIAKRPSLKIVNLEMARGSQVVESLRDPNTVGLIFISHSFTTPLGGAVLVGADMQPLPTELLSAATSSLRFAAFLGCHGPSIVKQYQVGFELDRLNNQTTFYSTDDKFLTTKSFILGRDNLLKALKQIAQELLGTEFQFEGGAPKEEPTEVVSVLASDVVESYEPRYVLVNGRIVGVLGGKNGLFNKDKSFEFFDWHFEPRFLKASGCQRVAIRSAELTSGALSDDYLIKAVQVGTIKRHYEIPLHLGDDQSIPPVEFKPPPLSKAREALLKRDPSRWKEYQERLKQMELEHRVRSLEWMNRDPQDWPALLGRFYSECI